jgi:hypothetical protein
MVGLQMALMIKRATACSYPTAARSLRRQGQNIDEDWPVVLAEINRRAGYV